MKVIRLILKILLPLLVLGGAFLFSDYLIQTRPEAKKAKTPPRAVLVKTMPVSAGPEQVVVAAMGTVIPAKTIVLQPEVSGRLIFQNPSLVPGGSFREGEEIVRIDPRNYQLAVEQQLANVERARFELKVEEGRKAIAEKEWELLEADIPVSESGRQLALRIPHIQNARVALEAAESGLKLARLNLERTVITAPFNAMVLEEFTDIGQLVAPQTNLARLVSTDEFWVQVSVPVDRLDWIFIPGVNSPRSSRVTVVQGMGTESEVRRRGDVFRLQADLDPAGRMARLLVRVKDPLSPDSRRSPLLLGSYVRVEIAGRQLDHVFRIPRQAVHQGDTVYVMDEEDRLDIREVAIDWRTEEAVFVRSGLRPAERIVTSSIAKPAQGMALRTNGPGQPASGDSMTAQASETMAREE
ncbi:MAG: efflux RND transporter periplasmic adaptor subunit [Acidobacteria bacterium]|nr:efflux RND transporter periplasmic adaptor subunit [Acidobacteriota bacterium]